MLCDGTKILRMVTVQGSCSSVIFYFCTDTGSQSYQKSVRIFEVGFCDGIKINNIQFTLPALPLEEF
jgi:hypothetical protein